MALPNEHEAVLRPAVTLSASTNKSISHLALNLVWTWLALNNGLPELAIRSLSTASWHATHLTYWPREVRPLVEAIRARIDELPSATSRALISGALPARVA